MGGPGHVLGVAALEPFACDPMGGGAPGGGQASGVLRRFAKDVGTSNHFVTINWRKLGVGVE